MTSKNLQRYYTLKCLIRDLLSNVFVFAKILTCQGFYLFRGRGMRRVQISRDTCTRFARYLYSSKQCWIIKRFIVDICYLILDTHTKKSRFTHSGSSELSEVMLFCNWSFKAVDGSMW